MVPILALGRWVKVQTQIHLSNESDGEIESLAGRQIDRRHKWRNTTASLCDLQFVRDWHFGAQLWKQTSQTLGQRYRGIRQALLILHKLSRCCG